MHFHYKGQEVVLDPVTVKDIRQQLQPQVSKMTLGETAELIKACGVSPKLVVDFLRKKIKEKL